MSETTQIAARVPMELAKDLERIAKADDRTVSYVVRQALRDHVQRFDAEAAA